MKTSHTATTAAGGRSPLETEELPPPVKDLQQEDEDTNVRRRHQIDRSAGDEGIDDAQADDTKLTEVKEGV